MEHPVAELTSFLNNNDEKGNMAHEVHLKTFTTSFFLFGQDGSGESETRGKEVQQEQHEKTLDTKTSNSRRTFQTLLRTASTTPFAGFFKTKCIPLTAQEEQPPEVSTLRHRRQAPARFAAMSDVSAVKFEAFP